MSTDYYRFKFPITSIKIVDDGPHKRIKIWIRRQLSGEIIIDKCDINLVTDMFVNRDCRVFSHYWGGEGAGVIYSLHDEHVSDDEYVISDRFEVIPAKEILDHINAIN